MRQAITDYLFRTKGPLTVFWSVIVVIAAVFLTFLVTQSYYEGQLDKQAQTSLDTATQMSADFRAITDQTQGKIDCSQIFTSSNLGYCESAAQSRK